MPRCDRGHEVPDGQRYCGTCGETMIGTAQTDSPPDEDKRPPWVLVGAVAAAGAVIAGLVLASALGGSSDESRAQPATTTTVAEANPEDLCYQDIAGALDAAFASTTNIQDTLIAVIRTYGSEDPRTDILRQVLRDYSSDQLAEGTDTAFANAADTMFSWCELNAEDLGYSHGE